MEGVAAAGEQCDDLIFGQRAARERAGNDRVEPSVNRSDPQLRVRFIQCSWNPWIGARESFAVHPPRDGASQRTIKPDFRVTNVRRVNGKALDENLPGLGGLLDQRFYLRPGPLRIDVVRRNR